ncbi:hypothetical protein CC86DRAFT_412195 [Ophiobolus disseminans]|uniref:Uncharacterized protein n=1 Tax=Ophiobolus disseminans TaxID=1469910 RepID=A0A6A6ZH05_9PLEO|nr:hypothetical protein CC86DRAFT_412195 [Ophiobolus disseminans]
MEFNHRFYSNTFDFEVTHTDDQEHIHGYQKLEHFLKAQFQMFTPFHIGLCSIIYGGTSEFQLSFALNSKQPLYHRKLRFNATQMIQATFMLSKNVNIIIRLRGTNPITNQPHLSEKSFTLHRIRRAALHVWPRARAGFKEACPEIWMDGRCKVLEVNKVKTNARGGVSANPATEGRLNVAGKVNEYLRENHNGKATFVPYLEDGSLYGMREWLRAQCA